MLKADSSSDLLLRAAVEYAERGWRLFPIHPVRADGTCTCWDRDCDKAGKHPAVTGWTTDARADPTEVENGWTVWPAHGIGWVPGLSSHAVIDVDVTYVLGEDGHYRLVNVGQRSLDAWCKVNGVVLPPTLAQRTGSGGTQLVLELQPGVELAQKVGWLDHVDVKSSRSMVVLPPSVHRSGEHYAWSNSEPIAMMPAAMVEAIQSSRGGGGCGGGGGSSQFFEMSELLTIAKNGFGYPGRDNGFWSLAVSCKKHGLSKQQALDLANEAYDNTEQPAGHEFRRSAALAKVERVYGCDDFEPLDPVLVQWAMKYGRPSASDEGDDDEDDGWTPHDIKAAVAEILAGTRVRKTPSIGMKEAGGALFYDGKVNGVAGPSGCGKSFIAALIVQQEMQRERTVLYIDYEADQYDLVQRLLDAGTDPTLIGERLIHVSPASRSRPAILDRLADGVHLAVVDSTGESMATDGVKPNDDDDVARWFRSLPRHLERRGLCVICVDHVPRSTENRAQPIGSQRKLAAITGVQYMVEPVRAFTQEQAGTTSFTTAKDRYGTYAKGQVAGVFEVQPLGGGRLQMWFGDQVSLATLAQEGVDLEDRIVEAVRQEPGRPKSTYYPRVRGNKANFDGAFDALVAEGRIVKKGAKCFVEGLDHD